ncbi:hypothetical protein Bca52824_096622 [Brassica carinata]|uniref:Uncharacterized protein n=1 Tax=Brassica carinata TaxID=52824 RepID=A0A8X7TH20_BRACI|nr:hypothetical protein Bca52824_096622 [Brassica carinata]
MLENQGEDELGEGLKAKKRVKETKVITNACALPLAEGTPAQCHKSPPPILSRISDGSWSLRCYARRWPKSELGDARSVLTCGGEFNFAKSPYAFVRSSDDPKSSTRPPGAAHEVGLFGNAAPIGRKFGPLNMGETDSQQVPRGKDEKDFEKRVKECLKLSEGSGWGRAMRPVGCGTEQSVRRRFGADRRLSTRFTARLASALSGRRPVALIFNLPGNTDQASLTCARSQRVSKPVYGEADWLDPSRAQPTDLDLPAAGSSVA